MKTKTCKQCGEPFPVVERGDDPTELDTGTVYVGENAEICLNCHRSKSGGGGSPERESAAAGSSRENPNTLIT